MAATIELIGVLYEIKGSEPALLEMSFTVIITEGTKPAYKRGERNERRVGQTVHDGSADEHSENGFPSSPNCPCSQGKDNCITADQLRVLVSGAWRITF